MKLILSALLLCGAFFSCNVTAQDPSPTMPVCLEGEIPLPLRAACGTPAPLTSCKLKQIQLMGSGFPMNPSTHLTMSAVTAHFSKNNFERPPPYDCPSSTGSITHTPKFRATHDISQPSCTTDVPYVDVTFKYTEYTTTLTSTTIRNETGKIGCDVSDPVEQQTYQKAGTARFTFEQSEEVECPAEYPEGPISYDDGVTVGDFCFYIPVDEPPPIDCENDPLNPCPPPPCVPGGGGMMVCKDNPDDKCWLDAFGQTQCEEGCGFINEEFFCTIEGDDNPSFEKCKFTTNGYACPSEPKDDITDPDKTHDEMKKKDFKDVNIGIESRQDVTNDLLQTQLAEWNRESNETQSALSDMNQNLGAKLNTANGHLSDMSQTLTDIGDFLKPADGAIDPPPPEPESWYESEYENGMVGIWEERSAALMQTPVFDFMNQFKLTPSGGQPEMRLCFNFIVDLGCHTPEIPSGLWAFLRLVILITAAFACRKIIVGG